ncbi:GTP cyclohydrolase I [Streptomyces anthocyanicus]|uniref:GTP cyclohydrolase I n=1 Tax=Streptomyces anthocyanicus TaxID=68174 RepID=UPI00382DBF60
MTTDMTAGPAIAPTPALAPINQARVADLYRQLLKELGEDPDREGLQDTPERVARWWAEFLEHDPGRTDTTFLHEELHATDGQDIVLVSGIGVQSLCIGKPGYQDLRNAPLRASSAASSACPRLPGSLRRTGTGCNSRNAS